jgi:hypothetical protein
MCVLPGQRTLRIGLGDYIAMGEETGLSSWAQCTHRYLEGKRKREEKGHPGKEGQAIQHWLGRQGQEPLEATNGLKMDPPSSCQ